MNLSLVTLALALVLMSVIGLVFEHRNWSLRKISIITALSTLAAVGRIPFAAIPSVQPTTFLVIATGYVFGPLSGFLTGAVAAFVSNVFLGQGPWTIWQMFAWGLCGLSAGWLKMVIPRENIALLIVFGVLWGFLFGWIMNLWHWLTFVFPHTWQTWLATNLASLGFDALHAAANGAFLLLAGKPFLRIMKRYQAKIQEP